jgi:hypothetical protein
MEEEEAKKSVMVIKWYSGTEYYTESQVSDMNQVGHSVKTKKKIFSFSKNSF